MLREISACFTIWQWEISISISGHACIELFAMFTLSAVFHWEFTCPLVWPFLMTLRKAPVPCILLINICWLIFACVYLSSRAFPFSAVFLVSTLCIPMVLVLFYVWLFHHPGLWRTTMKRLMRYGLVINDKQLLLKSRTSCQHSDFPKCLGHLFRNPRRVSVSLAFWRISAWDRQHGRTVKQEHINRHFPSSMILEEFWFIILSHFFNIPCIVRSLF